VYTVLPCVFLSAAPLSRASSELHRKHANNLAANGFPFLHMDLIYGALPTESQWRKFPSLRTQIHRNTDPCVAVLSLFFSVSSRRALCHKESIFSFLYFQRVFFLYILLLICLHGRRRPECCPEDEFQPPQFKIRSHFLKRRHNPLQPMLTGVTAFCPQSIWDFHMVLTINSDW
jgi:hypothetical protein